MRRTCLIILTASLAVLLPGARQPFAEELRPGLTYEAIDGYHVVVIDVGSGAWEVRANHPKAGVGEDFATVEAHALEEGAVVAINANYFDRAKGGTCGAARGFGEQFSETYRESPCSTSLGWTQASAEIFSGNGHEEDSTFRPELTEIVTGGGTILKTGPEPDWYEVSMPTGRAMTAMGVTADRSRFVFLVTDRTTSSLTRMRTTLESHGVTDAIFLDGGGSSRLWIEGRGTVNLVEGSDRSVPVVVLAIARPLPPDAAPAPDAPGIDAAPGDAAGAGPGDGGGSLDAVGGAGDGLSSACGCRAAAARSPGGLAPGATALALAALGLVRAASRRRGRGSAVGRPGPVYPPRGR